MDTLYMIFARVANVKKIVEKIVGEALRPLANIRFSQHTLIMLMLLQQEEISQFYRNMIIFAVHRTFPD